jgi:hypothetical protein
MPPRICSHPSFRGRSRTVHPGRSPEFWIGISGSTLFPLRGPTGGLRCRSSFTSNSSEQHYLAGRLSLPNERGSVLDPQQSGQLMLRRGKILVAVRGWLVPQAVGR